MTPFPKAFLILVTIKSENVVLCLLDVKHQMFLSKKIKIKVRRFQTG